MEAIILAGGFGTRLRPLTYSRAKSLLPILNKPMITYLLESLPNEVDKVILAVNYKKNQIENYFKKNEFDQELIVNDESKPLGTGGAVKFAEKYLTGSFLVLNSDIICSLNISRMIEYHEKNKSKATISLWSVKNVSEFGVADYRRDGHIVGFVEKPRPEDAPSNLINAGAYFLDTDILDYIVKDRLVSMEKEIFPKIINDTHRFFGFIFDGFWMDIGRISSYIKVNKFLLKIQKKDSLVGNNSKIDGILKKSSIGKQVYIGNNSFINSSVVYNNTKIEENVSIDNCVIGENCVIKNNCHLKNTVVGDNEIINERTDYESKLIWTQDIPNGYPDKQIGNVIENK
jgi:mannose-1-phosphate guanylyltransferase